jgi:hypothetical protein
MELKSGKAERDFKTQVKPMKEVNRIVNPGNDSIVHTVRHSEQFAFSKWINQ